MDSQRQQVAERIKQSNNILITVSSNPSVDQLAACIGLTLALNKMGKHATAVFSGDVPSTLEFLQPEKTIEKNTDSLRDFIISLDKSKADKLRYKVEDKVVKIFITPYRTSISDKDLEFSQGDFNVDVVVALGVHNQADLDQAITSHGRILHDATVATVNVRPGGELGSINWLDVGASSLSELAVRLIEDLDKNLLDTQIATAFLTGIVAETDRFSNAKTSPQTMSISAALMTAGANQQLVATKLEEPVKVPEPAPAPQPEGGEGQQPAEEQKDQVADDGTLEISHDASEEAPKPEENQPEQQEGEGQQPQPEQQPEAQQQPEEDHKPVAEPPHNPDSSEPYIQDKPELRIEPPKHDEEAPKEEAPQPEQQKPEEQPEEKHDEPPYQPIAPEIHIDETGALHLPPKDDGPLPEISHHSEAPKMVTPPPAAANGQLTANTEPEKLSPSTDPLTLPPVDGPMLSHEGYGPSEPVGSTILPPSEGVTAESLPPLPGLDQSGPQSGAPSPATPPLDLPSPSFSPPPMQIPPTPPANDAPAMQPPATTPPVDTTLSELERQLHSDHTQQSNTAAPAPQPTNSQPVMQIPDTPALSATDNKSDQIDLEKARSAVEDAISASGIQPLQPIQALNAQPLPPLNTQPQGPVTSQPPVIDPNTGEFNPAPAPQNQPQFGMPQPQTAPTDPNSPPPVPPPMMPPMPPHQ